MDTRKRRGPWLLGTLGLLGLFYLTVPVRLGIVVGNSMSPSMKNGNLYLLERPSRGPLQVRKGDVVVFRHNGTTYLKRVLASPGDTVYVLTFPGTGRDEFLMEWELERMRRVTTRTGNSVSAKVVSRKVPPGFFYAVGDHLSASLDSREYGPVPAESIIGKLLNPPGPQPDLANVAAHYVPHIVPDRS